MNRIYQGRVSRAELIVIDERGNVLPRMPDWDGEAALWAHHALFQDAVNYYVVCLLALAQPGNAVFPIRERLDVKNEAGGDDERMDLRSFRRRGAMWRGLRDSVVPYLCPGNKEATPEDCFAAVLAGNESAQSEEGRKRLDAGLTQILGKCTGESGCRNSSKEYLPRLASPDYGGSYGEDSTTLVRENQAARFPFLLHDAATNADTAALEEFGVHSIALRNERKPKFAGKEAVAKLRGMVGGWRERMPEAEADWARLDAAIGRLPETVEIPGYAPTSAKNDVKFYLFAMFLFKYVERSAFTLGLLRATARKPAEGDEAPAAIAAASGDGDPIRAARGARGFVFRAFTSLPCWGGDEKGTPQWVQFDFAAFCEALKALHQVDAKAEERAKARKKKQVQHEYQRQYDAETNKPARKKWKGDGEGDEGVRPPLLTGDPRIKRLEDLLSGDLAEEYAMAEGVSVEYGLQQRTIRGFRDIRKKWNDSLGEGEGYSDAAKAKLWDLLTDYKKENAQTIGSPVLFDALLKEENWLIWREPTAEQLREWRKDARLPDDAEFAKDPLQALTDERELIEEIERLKGPIRFTPADAEHSRRQFYFSDVTALDKKGRLRHDRQTLETEIAVQSGNKWERKWARIEFTAPRLLRDQLNNSGGAEAAWQQAMMAALGLKTGLLKNGKPASFAECAAVALMPEVSESGRKRILLNFPLTLDGESIAAQIGRAARWDALQFGGADGESYWLRWPGTWIDEKKARKKAPPAPWWKGTKPFRVLSVDLGQRDAGAFALLEASPGSAPKPQSRKLGAADGKTWWATLRATGMLRLPGEDAKVMRDGLWQEELSGSRGRLALESETKSETTDCRTIFCRLLGENDAFELILRRKRNDEPLTKMDAVFKTLSYPEQNDRLLFALRRAQARLARLQSWSAIAHEDTKPARRDRIVEQINKAEDDPLGLKPLVAQQQWVRVAGTLCEVIRKEREVLKVELVRIADRIQPLRGRRWEWALRDDGSKCHVLRQTLRGTDDREKMLAGQRGLSMKRIEQLESLRQRCQSLNRALMQEPGKPSAVGRRSRGVELADPCPELLDRLEALKEQRVNQTAHLILAQALGVRLMRHEKDDATRAAQDIHGEYERIPGREPVDFLVLENLDRYLASQGRGRGENSKLMKWSHRAILGKLKQLCEPYGLRVLETPAAYSSRFCSLSGVAGFRAVELTPEEAKEFRWKKHLDRLADPKHEAKLNREEREESQRVKSLFDSLAQMNADIRKSNAARPKWRTLLAPVTGGPIFVPASELEHYERVNQKTGKNEPAIRFAKVRGRRPVIGQADINAAINLGLRAIAAPDADDIHLRIRAARKDKGFVVRAENARERARWEDKEGNIAVPKESDRKKLLADAYLNFFADLGDVADYDAAQIDGKSGYASGRGIWGTIKGNQWHAGKDWLRVQEINAARLRACGLTPPPGWEKAEDEVPI